MVLWLMFYLKQKERNRSQLTMQRSRLVHLCFEIVNSGIFNDLKSFDEFNIRILNNYDFNKRGQDKTKGDIFEIFCEAYLFTKKELQIKEVFPQGNVPFYILKNIKILY
jgi:hypothetical protein